VYGLSLSFCGAAERKQVFPRPGSSAERAPSVLGRGRVAAPRQPWEPRAEEVFRLGDAAGLPARAAHPLAGHPAQKDEQAVSTS